MQPLASGLKLAAYHQRLRSSHDFDVAVDVLDLDENPVGSATMLEGQVDLQARGEPIRRKCTLILSDPGGALDASAGATWHGSGLWLNRLVRVRHLLDVPGYGTVTAVPFIGPPQSLSRQGAEVQVDCSDKAALAIRGAASLKFGKGYNAVNAIKRIMAERTGEFRFRIESSRRTLSKDYSVGLADEASPWAVARRIASDELDLELGYSCDGYLTLRPLPTQPSADLGLALSVPQSTADFTTVVNKAFVYGTDASSQLAVADDDPVSAVTVQRQGVPRVLPIVVTEDGYRTTAQTTARARKEITTKARVAEKSNVSVVPVFHLDSDDIVTYEDAGGATQQTRLGEASIPLGVGDDGGMSLGYKRRIGVKTATKRPRTRGRR